MVLHHVLADRVHQVRLAETDTAVDEQRVVGAAGILRDLNRGGLGELVALAFDEAVEGEVRIQPNAYDNTFAALGSCVAVGIDGHRPHRFGYSRANFHRHDGSISLDKAAHDLTETRQ